MMVFLDDFEDHPGWYTRRIIEVDYASDEKLDPKGPFQVSAYLLDKEKAPKFTKSDVIDCYSAKNLPKDVFVYDNFMPGQPYFHYLSIDGTATIRDAKTCELFSKVHFDINKSKTIPFTNCHLIKNKNQGYQIQGYVISMDEQTFKIFEKFQIERGLGLVESQTNVKFKNGELARVSIFASSNSTLLGSKDLRLPHFVGKQPNLSNEETFF